MSKTAHTPGPWTACNMVHVEGRPMTPEELGEYVTNSVKMGASDRFLFVSGKHEDGNDCDICHVGNGPKGPYNARLIAAAPCLLEALEWYKNQMCEGFCEDLKAEDYYSESMDFHCAGCKARAAIARAKGEA